MAATIETVSRVGPCSAQIDLEDIKDIREDKRKQIIKRATELLKKWDENSPEPREIEEQISQDIRLSEIKKWGPENLPAGPNVDISPDLIIVEGRADVLNLMRIDIKNAIAVEGTQVPKSIIELTHNKSPITAFLDGDRGGTIILNELLQVAHLDYFARAPNGLEVEELTRKQMVKALQNKRPVSEIVNNKILSVDISRKGKIVIEKKIKDSKNKYKNILKILKLNKGSKIAEYISNSKITKKAIGIDSEENILFELDTSEVFDNLSEFSAIKYLILDGILSKRLISLAIKMKIDAIICVGTEENLKIPRQIKVIKV